MAQEDLKVAIARHLLDIKAVFLRPDEPFTWASGIKSPIYTDNRLTLSTPEVREAVERGLAQTIQQYFPQAQALMGTATAGIAHAAITAYLLDMPMGYVRSSAKSHGRNNRIEGRLDQGAKVVVVEDLISTAGSVGDVVAAVREAGAEVLGIVSIFTYGMAAADQRLQEIGMVNHSLTDFDAVVRVAAQEGYIQPSDVARLLAFRDNPADESWIDGGSHKADQ
ncbi:MAG: orotate phosphoribosyltransferase [Actinomycetaceae bacterium]|nr:orotate phosphoribosyltransferase [Actinomycetaceae bacterium]MDY5853959.1 orotate phosphoribosyltransferase [Arcanobacterium sp.]